MTGASFRALGDFFIIMVHWAQYKPFLWLIRLLETVSCVKAVSDWHLLDPPAGFVEPLWVGEVSSSYRSCCFVNFAASYDSNLALTNFVLSRGLIRQYKWDQLLYTFNLLRQNICIFKSRYVNSPLPVSHLFCLVCVAGMGRYCAVGLSQLVCWKRVACYCWKHS